MLRVQFLLSAPVAHIISIFPPKVYKLDGESSSQEMRKEKCERGGMAYTVDLESTINQDIWVQIPSLAPFENYKNFCYNIYRKLRKNKRKKIYIIQKI